MAIYIHMYIYIYITIYIYQKMEITPSGEFLSNTRRRRCRALRAFGQLAGAEQGTVRPT